MLYPQMDRPESAKKSSLLRIRLSEGLRDRFFERAYEERRTASDLLRIIVEDYLSENSDTGRKRDTLTPLIDKIVTALEKLSMREQRSWLHVISERIPSRDPVHAPQKSLKRAKQRKI